MSNATDWMPTDHIICGDAQITEYQTDNKPIPVTAPNGTWIRMRGTDSNGVVRTFERTGGAWVEQN